MQKVKSFIKNNWEYLLALLIPWVIALTHSAVSNTWVTGGGNIATGDMQAQIIPIAYELWDKIHTHQSLMYTWHLADGADFNSLIGYLISPFTIIMMLLPRNMIADYMQFVMIVKWSLCSGSMVYFFNKTRFNNLNEYKKTVSLFLGLAYALGNGIMSYICYVQFMDTLICFPILLLLIEKLVTEKKWKLYYIVLSFAIMCSNYLSFQICVFLIMWFGLQIIGEKEKLKKFLVFAGVSVLAAVTNACTLLVGLKLAGGRLGLDDAEAKAAYLSKPLISVTDFVKQLFAFTPISSANYYTPNIYFSVTASVLLLLFPFIVINKKRKILSLMIGVILILSFFSGHLSLVWHMMNIPNGVYHRFMYLFSFFMLFSLLLILQRLEDIGILHIAIAGIISVCMFIYTFFSISTYGAVITYLSTVMIIVFIVLIMILLIRKSISYKNALLVIALVGILEVSANSFTDFSYHEGELYYGKEGYMNQACELLEKAGLNPGERITTASPSPDIGLMTGQNTDSVFMSSINSSNKLLHESLGMASNSKVEYEVRGGSPLINLIYNIRYGHGESKMLFSDETLVGNDEFYQLYRMEHIAGLGYMVDEDIVNWNAEGKNCFQFQNDFVKRSVSGDDLFSAAKVDAGLIDFLGQSYLPDEERLNEFGVYDYTIDEPYGNEYDARELVFEVNEDMDLYVFFWSPNNMQIDIFIDGEMQHADFRPFDQCTYHVGNVKTGQRIAVCAVPSGKTAAGEKQRLVFLLSKFDRNAFDMAYEKLSSSVYDIEIEEADHISGTIKADKDGIMMTSIPADQGISVYVDGNKTEYKTIAGALIGVPLDMGEHNVEFYYETPYLRLGVFVSVASVIIFIFLCVISRNKTAE